MSGNKLASSLFVVSFKITQDKKIVYITVLDHISEIQSGARKEKAEKQYTKEMET